MFPYLKKVYVNVLNPLLVDGCVPETKEKPVIRVSCISELNLNQPDSLVSVKMFNEIFNYLRMSL